VTDDSGESELQRPIVDPAEVAAFLRGLPLAMDPGFTRFVLGFPRKYLAETPRAEVVKHYALAGSLGAKPVISSLARGDAALWKLSVITRDRRFLFARIAGALSSSGMDIVAAEAFANASAVVLDTFWFRDEEGRFGDHGLRRRFQVFLEEAVEGKVDLAALMKERLARRPAAPSVDGFEVAMEDEPALGATRLRLGGPDRFGLLYLFTLRLAEAGADIVLATIATHKGRVRDEFLLTREGRPLGAEGRAEIERALKSLAILRPREAGDRKAPAP
jgi:UTP:GlnB (protein PII) uridylyltransferase